MDARAGLAVRRAGWSERVFEGWIQARNRLIASPAFQRWAAKSPLTRMIARRRARQLFDLCSGFVYSQVLLACVRLRLFEFLAQGPRGLEAISRHFDLPPDATSRLLRSAAALGLARALDGDRWVLDELGAAMLGNPEIAAFIEHNALLYDDLRDPVALLRGEVSTRLGQFWPYAADRPRERGAHAESEDYGAYSALMSQTQSLVNQDILDAYRVANHERMLDVGGGEGAFVAAAAARAPDLKFYLFDLPPVAERARARLAALGLAARVDVAGGSFLDDPLPSGADLVTIVRVLHDHDDESALALLRAARAALAPGGTVLVAEPMSGARGAEPMGDAYFGFYLLAMGRGRPRSAGEVAGLMRAAGFAAVRELPTRRPMLASALIGRST
jgi:demethylspheroidene O-methyltransferase